MISRRRFLRSTAAGLFLPASGIAGTIALHNRLYEEATSWRQRVINNGGAVPSNNTVQALNQFMHALYADGLRSDGLRQKIMSCMPIAPDSLIAAQTPLIKMTGTNTVENDPWGNTNFVGGDLTVNGLKSDATKTLDSGLFPSYIYPNNTIKGWAHQCYYISANGNNNNEWDMGAGQFPNWMSMGTNGTNSRWDCFDVNDSAHTEILVANASWNGFIIGNHQIPGGVAGSMIMCKANSTTAFTQIGSNTGSNQAGNGSSISGYTIHLFASPGSVTATNSTKRISFCCFGYGMTVDQCKMLYNAVQNLRMNLGGGYV